LVSRHGGALEAGAVGVVAERLVRLKVAGALDGQAEPSAHGRQFRQRNIADLRAAEAEVAEAEGGVFVAGVDFG
jgi:hypothetical protein